MVFPFVYENQENWSRLVIFERLKIRLTKYEEQNTLISFELEKDSKPYSQ